MTRSNLNKLKCELLKLYEETGDVFSLINDAVRVGMLHERTKDSDDVEITMENVTEEFEKSL